MIACAFLTPYGINVIELPDAAQQAQTRHVREEDLFFHYDDEHAVPPHQRIERNDRARQGAPHRSIDRTSIRTSH